MENSWLMDAVQTLLGSLVSALSAVLFFDIAGIPFIVLWLAGAALFFTVYLRGVNFRLFGHACALVLRNEGDARGEVSRLQGLFSALAGTVGLGSIAGISVGVVIGGPGAVFWIVVAGLLGMASKFAEVTLSQQYRRMDDNGKVFGGAFHYIEHGLAERGLRQLGRLLAIVFALFCLGGALGGGNMFQSNQAVKMLTHSIPALKGLAWIPSLAMAGVVCVALLGSIRRIAKIADVVTPLKGGLYLLCALVIIGTHLDKLPATFAAIFSSAFTGEAAVGGMIGMISLAFKRAMFANEAGLGSAPIAHAAARASTPVEQGIVALLEPFFAAMVGLLTGLIVLITQSHIGATADDGVLIAARAFSTVSQWFTLLLTLNVLVFAYSTTIAWSYYGEIAWSYLFGRRRLRAYHLLFCSATFLGGVLHFGVVLDLSDLLILGMSLPNLIAVYLLRDKVKSALQSYMRQLRAV